MRYCTRCGNAIPADVEAVLIGTHEQGSGPGIPMYRHPACTREEWSPSSGQPTPQIGVRRAP